MEIINAIFNWLSTIMVWAVNIEIIDNITIGELVFGLLIVGILFTFLIQYYNSKKG